ncbi:hypothetical protein TVAG_278440 [Trichomonas vaginalis G3]|uniref:HECT domain-containing protein n=1 Tax=Trichomonas vaginalis (strain ATCC PRA-98 / G3) TaxID=412133 RepID=A2DU85_TRIV3|nr:ubiquitin protein ligase protein [Trichomonas vaginalis G3]EAY16078.1 hypothetical protein TVAG_278440 [Trichomonas vaginalis G3]KAI5537256.1 ubiquitin protein ligase protein [Trichomonas vaginalis G3]|eukprot:XP_001328301.1 hypothetical protein [Trichomonas vaginalis G3]
MIQYKLSKTVGTENVTRFKKQYVFGYPCNDNQFECSPYTVYLPIGSYQIEALGARGSYASWKEGPSYPGYGFLTVIPLEYMKTLTQDIIEELLCGDNEISAYQLASILHFKGNYTLHNRMFIKCIEEMTNKERISLIRFITGFTSKPDKITVYFIDDGREHDMINGLLPYAHTCFKSIDMFLYTSYEVMLSKLRTAIEYGSFISDGVFNFAAYMGDINLNSD